jgi:hypothetical protein
MAHLQPVAVVQTSSSLAGCTAMPRGASPSPSTALACKRETDSEAWGVVGWDGRCHNVQGLGRGEARWTEAQI